MKLSATESSLLVDLPTFQPCLDLCEDIVYVWRVFLGPKDGEYEIQCFRIAHDWEKDQIKHIEQVDWQAKAV